MPDRTTNFDIPLSETRQISMERFGLSSEAKDYNLFRILNLACRLLGAKAASFSIPVRGGGSAILAFTGDTIKEPPRASKGCIETFTKCEVNIINDISAQNWVEDCPTLEGIKLTGYIGVPIYSPENLVHGVLSLFYEKNLTQLNPEQLQSLNDFGRLIEDSLIMKSLNIRDPLTQMFNRRYLERQARIEWRRAMRLDASLSVAMIDVDNFKSYNDTMGHQAGDKVLIRLANVIAQVCLRAGDSACRYGGEEFAILLPMTEAQDAEVLLNKMRQEFIALNIKHPGQNNTPVTFSCGITTKKLSQNTEKSEKVRGAFKEADTALYAAKHAGRNRIMHYNDLVDDLNPSIDD
jgi:diguanylate cyclase (GGDEF)-like protein